MYTDDEIEKNALARAKKLKKTYAKEATDKKIYLPESNPVTVYMAGSPGAGKTESSKRLLSALKDISPGEIIRIDPDELRNLFEGYDGSNAHLFQHAVWIVANRIIDMAYENKQSILVDGTLAGDYYTIRDNIARAIKKGRSVSIFYVYQHPLLAWDFAKKREIEEGRKVIRSNFIAQYFEARSNVNRLKKHFKKDIEVDLLLKNYDGSGREFFFNVENIDFHIPEKYEKSVGYKNSLESIIPKD